MTTTNIRRIYLNSYLEYAGDAYESLQDFIMTLKDPIVNPDDINILNVSLDFRPEAPNIPSYESTVVMTYDSVDATFSIPTTSIYVGPTNPSSLPGTDLVSELNTAFKAAYSTAYEPFAYDTDAARITFTAEALKAFSFNTGTTLSRRMGLANTQIDVSQSAGSTLTCSNGPILARTQAVFVTTDITNDSVTNTGNTNNILQMIPIYDATYGSLINQSPSYDAGSLSSPRSFSYVRITLLDDQFQPIAWNGNANMIVSLYIQYKDENAPERTLRFRDTL